MSLSSSYRQVIVDGGSEAMENIPGGAGVPAGIVSGIRNTEPVRAAERGARVCQRVPEGVRGDELETLRITFLQLGGHPVVISITERGRAGNAPDIRVQQKSGAQAVTSDAGVGGPEIRTGVRIGLEKLMRLMIPNIGYVEDRLPR